MRVAPAGPHLACPGRTRPAAWELAALVATLTLYNLALNHTPVPAWAYVPANLSLATGIALLARRRWGMRGTELGLARGSVRPGLAVAAAATGAVAVLLAVAPALSWTAPLLGDRRAAGLSGLALAYAVLVRIPLGTALPEELLFRGVLLAAYRRRTTETRAVLASSLAFGIWHIGPGLAVLRAGGLSPGAGGTTLAVSGMVMLTTAAGVLFCLLRRWGRGLVAPVAVHAAVNGLSLLAAVRFQA